MASMNIRTENFEAVGLSKKFVNVKLVINFDVLNQNLLFVFSCDY